MTVECKTDEKFLALQLVTIIQNNIALKWFNQTVKQYIWKELVLLYADVSLGVPAPHKETQEVSYDLVVLLPIISTIE